MTRQPTLVLLIAALLAALAGCSRQSPPAQIGDPAPLFTVVDSGKRVSLEELRGRIVVLNFWATWCPPCVEEMPSLVELQRRMAGQIVVVAVSIDQDRRAYERFLREHNIADLTVIRDPAQSSNSLYGSFRLPETFIIDRQGQVRRKFVGPADWVSAEIVSYLSALYEEQAAEGVPASASRSQPAASAARSQ